MHRKTPNEINLALPNTSWQAVAMLFSKLLSLLIFVKVIAIID